MKYLVLIIAIVISVNLNSFASNKYPYKHIIPNKNQSKTSLFNELKQNEINKLHHRLEINNPEALPSDIWFLKDQYEQLRDQLFLFIRASLAVTGVCWDNGTPLKYNKNFNNYRENAAGLYASKIALLGIDIQNKLSKENKPALSCNEISLQIYNNMFERVK